MKLSNSIEEFILEQRIRGNSKYTIEYYKRILHKFESFSEVENAKDITVNICRQFYLMLSDSGLVSVSVQSYIRGLRAYLKWLYVNEYIKQDISEKFRLPKAKQNIIDVLTDSELNFLLNSFDGDSYIGVRNLCMCSMMFDCGLRLHEVVSLRKEQLHLIEGYAIVTGKGNKQRVVPIGNQTGISLQKYLAIRSNGDMLFLKGDGSPIMDNTVKNLFRRLKVATGISRLHPHLLRHTFATRYLENGGNIYSLQMILGHTSLEMVKKYLHLANSRIRSDFVRYSPNDNLKRTP